MKMKLAIGLILIALMGSFPGLEAKSTKNKKNRPKTIQTQPSQPTFKKIIMYAEPTSGFITYRLWITLDANGKAIWQQQKKSGNDSATTKYGTWYVNSTYDSNGNRLEYYVIYINDLNLTMYIAKGSTRLYNNYNNFIKKNGDYESIRYLDY